MLKRKGIYTNRLFPDVCSSSCPFFLREKPIVTDNHFNIYVRKCLLNKKVTEYTSLPEAVC